MIPCALRAACFGAVADRWGGFVCISLSWPGQDSNASIAFDNQVLGRFIVVLEATHDLLCVATRGNCRRGCELHYHLAGRLSARQPHAIGGVEVTFG